MSKLRKILYFQNANLPTEWANGFQIMKTCESFAKAGIEVELVLPLRRNPQRHRGVFAYYNMPESFQVTWTRVFDVLPFVPKQLEPYAYVLERWTYLRLLTSIVRRTDASTTVIYTRDPVIADAVLNVRGDVQVCLELHDDPRTNVALWKRIREHVSYVVISGGLRDLLLSEQVPAERIQIAADGFDAELFARLPERERARRELGIEAGTRVILYTGQLLPWKGVDGIVAALDRIPEGCELVFIGGQKKDFMRLEAKMPKTHPRVRFLSERPREELLPWLAAADAGLLPTSATTAIGKLFTSPLKAFEYMAAGLPVIASDVPSSREVFSEEMAFFFTPDDAEDFLRAVSVFCGVADEQLEKMRAASRTRVQGCSWTERGARIVRGFLLR